MKYRLVKILLGVFIVISLLSGCNFLPKDSSGKENYNQESSSMNEEQVDDINNQTGSAQGNENSSNFFDDSGQSEKEKKELEAAPKSDEVDFGDANITDNEMQLTSLNVDVEALEKAVGRYLFNQGEERRNMSVLYAVSTEDGYECEFVFEHARVDGMNIKAFYLEKEDVFRVSLVEEDPSDTNEAETME